MSNTYYNSLSGMLAASYGLQNTSNNIANMQSPGFKRSDVFYSSLGNDQDGNGHGVHVGGSSINFTDARHTITGKASDLALVGDGFFVVRLKNNELLYTRSGAFEFENGVLVDKRNGGLVQGYDSAGNLVAIHEKGPKISKANASRNVLLKGTFAIKKSTPPNSQDPNNKDNTDNKYENVIFELKDIYDDQGKVHTITFEFKHAVPLFPQSDPRSCWEIADISCSDAKIDPASYWGQQIELQSLNTNPVPTFGSHTLHFTLNGTQTVNINFGVTDDGSDKSVTFKEADEKSAIEAYENDGYGEGKQANYSFDEDGQLSYHYDNGQTIKGIHIGLARFENMEHNLVQTNDGFFKTKTNQGIHYGRPNQHGFAALRKEELENSNVDSTTEFANIVVLQRMFQACSQIMDIDKQLLQELESKS